MGWLFTQGQTRRQLIEHLTKTEENETRKFVTLKKYCSGNTMFTVQEVTNKTTGEAHKFIGVYLMQRDQNYGWGYKDMDESCGPYQVGCPLSFFDMVPDPGGYATDFRQRCRVSHARRFQKLIVGQMVRLTNGKDYKITSLKPLRGSDGWNVYRIPRRMLTQELAKKSEEIMEAANNA
jgi:hypothetical protein